MIRGMRGIRQAIRRLEEWPWGERYLTANRVLLLGCVGGPGIGLYLLISGAAEEVGTEGILLAFSSGPLWGFFFGHWLMRWKRDGSPPFQP